MERPFPGFAPKAKLLRNSNPNFIPKLPMSKTMENVKTANSVLRTGLMLLAVGALGYGGWLAYEHLIKPRIQAQLDLEEANKELVVLRDENAAKDKQLAELAEVNARLETANRLLKIDHRLAHVRVLEVGTEKQTVTNRKTGEDEETDVPYTRVSFQEVGQHGEQVGKKKEFKLKGREIRVDGLIVKFDDAFIEKSDLHRGTSLFMFKKIYGEMDGPMNGYSLEEQWSRPEAYSRGSKLSEFEEGIWNNFWTYANDPTRAKESGIRAAHGQVNYVQAEEGRVYEVNLRASDGLTIKPLEDDSRERDKQNTKSDKNQDTT